MAQQIPIERLLGSRVTDVDARAVGKIEEIIADGPPGDLRVVEFHVGSNALFERLGVTTLLAPVLRLFGIRHRRRTVIPWEKLDVSDPSHPRTTVPRDELDVRRFGLR
jgi:hypothetical protein